MYHIQVLIHHVLSLTQPDKGLARFIFLGNCCTCFPFDVEFMRVCDPCGTMIKHTNNCHIFY